MPDVEGAGRSRRDAHGHLVADVIEVRQPVHPLFLLLDQQVGIHPFQGLLLSIEVHGVHLLDHGIDERRYLGHFGAELRTFAEHLADNGFRVRLAFEEYRILQCIFPDSLFCLIHIIIFVSFQTDLRSLNGIP